MNKDKIFQIVSPIGNPTGGVELLHQMAHILLREGYEVNLYYWGKNKENKLIEYYKNYLIGVRIVNKLIDKKNVVTILPEVYSYFIKKLKKSKILFWWLSVDNYVDSKKIKFALKNKFLPYSYWNIKNDNKIFHAVQSEYAKIYLSKFDIKSDFDLSDYINDEYFNDFAIKSNLIADKRKDIVLFNPAKGGAEQKKLINFLQKNIKCTPLVNMTKKMMIKTLGESKVYIDFGEHPGKDRIPREAASLGCCIVTNKKGSAENDVDIFIPMTYKFDQTGDYFLNVQQKIEDIFQDFNTETSSFSEYRDRIRNEKELFIQQVQQFAEKI